MPLCLGKCNTGTHSEDGVITKDKRLANGIQGRGLEVCNTLVLKLMYS